MRQIPWLRVLAERLIEFANFLDDHLQSFLDKLWPDCPDATMDDMVCMIADNALTGIILGMNSPLVS